MGRMKSAAIRAEQAPGSDLFGWSGDGAAATAPPPAEAVPAPPVVPAPVVPAPVVSEKPPARAPLPVQKPLAPQMPLASAARAGLTTLYIVMPYADRSNGKGPAKWRPGAASSFTDPNRALRTAESCIGKGGIVGAIVGRQTAEADLGEWSEPEIIGRFGRTPELEG